MGVSSSKIDEGKALQLCRERKKFVRQALDGRCSLAAAHITYVQSLRHTGTALRKFVEPEGPIESSLYTSTNATPEPLALIEKSPSQFSFSSATFSQRVDAAETLSPSPSPPTSSRFQASHMRFRGISSQKVEEKPPSPAIGSVTSSSTPQATTPSFVEQPELSSFEGSAIPPETPPWDYFGLPHPIDHRFSFQEGKNMSQGFENVDDLRQLREDEGIPNLEDEEEKASFHGSEDSLDSEDGFDEPSTDTLVRSFENFNRLHEHNVRIALPTMPSARTVADDSEFMNVEKSNSPDPSPERTTSSAAGLESDAQKTPRKKDYIENKVSPKDFFSSMKDIELLFIKASDSGKEVPRMLEANKLHFRPIFPAKESGSMASTLFKAFFSCGGEDRSQVIEEPAPTEVKYLTWHRTTSSRSSSSRNPLGLNSKDDVDDVTNNLFDNICMMSGSHASTLDRLYAWERKLYDEVKASEMIRREYDFKCKILRQLESKGESSNKIDKTRVKLCKDFQHDAPNENIETSFVVCDEEFLPIKESSLDLVISCLGLHWTNDLPGAMIQCKLALKPDGLFLAAILGGETLKELRIACTLAQMEREGGISPRVSPLAQVRDAGNLLTRAGFSLPGVDVEEYVVKYKSSMELIEHLRSMGETNALLQRNNILKRETALATAAIYDAMFAAEDGTIPATFQVIYMTGWKEHHSQQKAKRRGSATVSFQDIQKEFGSGS